MTSTTVKLPPITCAPNLVNANAQEKKLYWDRSHYNDPDSQMVALSRSSTVYVGNLAFTTRSSHLRRHFEQAGPVRSVHIGLDRFKKVPCGFAFVEFSHRIDALASVANLTGTRLDGSLIRVELDAGFKPGREYGRGQSGGQVRDDRGGARRRSGSGKRKRDESLTARWEKPSEQSGAGEGSAMKES